MRQSPCLQETTEWGAGGKEERMTCRDLESAPFPTDKAGRSGEVDVGAGAHSRTLRLDRSLIAKQEFM